MPKVKKEKTPEDEIISILSEKETKPKSLTRKERL